MLLKTHSLAWYLQYFVLIAFKDWSAVFLIGLILLEAESAGAGALPAAMGNDHT